MKVEGRLFKRFDRDRIESEIEEELRFHLDLLAEEQLQKDLSWAEAEDAALRRFGNVEQIKDQCVEISSSGYPTVRALKAFLIPVFLLGVFARVFSTEFHFIRMGDLLIFVSVLGRLLVYVRGLNPSRFRAGPETSSLLMLNDKAEILIADEGIKLSPVERVISDK